MNKLYLDICTLQLFVGISTDKEKKVFNEITTKRTSEMMFPVIQKLLNEVGLTLQDIDEIYVTKGPGSYTGSRLGLTFAKVMKVLNPKLNIYTCSTLQALLASIPNTKGIALIDARNEAFFASTNIIDENDCDRLEKEEVQNLLDQGYEPIFYSYDNTNFINYKEYHSHSCNILDGMMKNKDIFIKIEDPNNIKPFYLKGHGRE